MAMLLPGPLQAWLERSAEDFLRPKGSTGFDFTSPPGEPALARYVRPLRPIERDAAYAEGVEAAKLYGVLSPPSSQAELDAVFEAHGPQLAPTPIVFEFLAILERTPILPPLFRPFQRPLLKASVELLPPWVRQRLNLGRNWSLNIAERALVTALARAADRIPLRGSPAAQASRRLGLPDTWLYR
jgi:uncharacterized protein (DUF2236 family)